MPGGVLHLEPGEDVLVLDPEPGSISEYVSQESSASQISATVVKLEQLEESLLPNIIICDTSHDNMPSGKNESLNTPESPLLGSHACSQFSSLVEANSELSGPRPPSCDLRRPQRLASFFSPACHSSISTFYHIFNLAFPFQT